MLLYNNLIIRWYLCLHINNYSYRKIHMKPFSFFSTPKNLYLQSPLCLGIATSCVCCLMFCPFFYHWFPAPAPPNAHILCLLPLFSMGLHMTYLCNCPWQNQEVRIEGWWKGPVILAQMCISKWRWTWPSFHLQTIHLNHIFNIPQFLVKHFS